jgi:subtilisin family serine protease
VIVGVIDSGIDWRHPDFINPDGTSRILAIWDYFDESYQSSNGKIGTIGPKLSPQGKNLWGTIYTNAQINAALKGTGTVNTSDVSGHGTAVAGTAAGNGRASDGKYAGVAPQADLIIVRASECDSFANWIPGAEWIIRTAKEYKKPVVINQSFGGHSSAHDGNQESEKYLNLVTGKDVPGVIFTVSAGNEGRFNLHATGRFGKTTGGGQEMSSPISINIFSRETEGEGTTFNGYFDAGDDWGIAVVPRSSADLTDADGKPLIFFVFKHQREVKYALLEGLKEPDWFADFGSDVIYGSGTDGVKDTLTLWLPPGSYDLFGYGTSANVVNGDFDFYIPNFETADFGRGTTKTGMVGSPGNAKNVITVGAYNFRNNWINNLNTQTVVNTPNGYISEYSNPGGVREKDKVVKPDLAAPATYTISPLSQTAGLNSTSCDGDSMGSRAGPARTTLNGKYISWEGTSASAPFVAGVIALMLQKNKTLDAEQVREIFKKTTKKGGIIGATPNPDWGFGMLDPAAALTATPPMKKKQNPRRGRKK